MALGFGKGFIVQDVKTEVICSFLSEIVWGLYGSRSEDKFTIHSFLK